MNVYEDVPHLVELIKTSSLISDPLRYLGWQLLVAISKLMDGAYTAINTLLGVNIMNIAPIRNLVGIVSPLAWVLMSLALICAAIFLMTHPDKLKLSEFARGLIFSVLLIVAIPFTFTTLNQIKTAGVTDVQNIIASQDSTPGKEMLRSVTYDIGESRSQLKNIPSSVNPYYLDVNAKLSRSDPWNYKITSIEEDNGRKIVKGEVLAAGTFGIGEEHVYAYSFEFVNTAIILLVSLIALIFVGLKVAQIIYDLCFYQIISPVIFATDLQNSGRSKKFLQTLISTYIVLIIILLLFKIYLDLSLWIATQSDFNFVARILLLAGAAKGLIDGPDLITRLLGVDAGVSNGMATMMGVSMAARGVSSVARGAGRTAGAAFQVARRTPGAVSGAAGRVSGYIGSRNQEARHQARSDGHDAHQSDDVTSMAQLRQQQQEQRQAEPSSFRRGQLSTTQAQERAGYRESRNASVGQSIGRMFSGQDAPSPAQGGNSPQNSAAGTNTPPANRNPSPAQTSTVANPGTQRAQNRQPTAPTATIANRGHQTNTSRTGSVPPPSGPPTTSVPHTPTSRAARPTTPRTGPRQ